MIHLQNEVYGMARTVLVAVFALCGCSKTIVFVRLDQVIDPLLAARSNRICFSVVNAGTVPVFVEEPRGAVCCETLVGTNWFPCEIDGHDSGALPGFRLDSGESRFIDMERPEAVEWEWEKTGEAPTWRFRLRFWRSETQGRTDWHFENGEEEWVSVLVRDVSPVEAIVLSEDRHEGSRLKTKWRARADHPDSLYFSMSNSSPEVLTFPGGTGLFEMERRDSPTSPWKQVEARGKLGPFAIRPRETVEGDVSFRDAFRGENVRIRFSYWSEDPETGGRLHRPCIYPSDVFDDTLSPFSPEKPNN